jgi:hypothetical protein
MFSLIEGELFSISFHNCLPSLQYNKIQLPKHIIITGIDPEQLKKYLSVQDTLDAADIGLLHFYFLSLIYTYTHMYIYMHKFIYIFGYMSSYVRM